MFQILFAILPALAVQAADAPVCPGYVPPAPEASLSVETQRAALEQLTRARRACPVAPIVARELPEWLRGRVGEGANQISARVLDRARAAYGEALIRGRTRNACYVAMDSTRPHAIGNGRAANRFFVICEPYRFLLAVSAGHGSGVAVPGVQVQNGQRCAKHFSDAAFSHTTMGGLYLTAEIALTFKGLYRDAGGRLQEYVRPFLNFDGEGETEAARDRGIGGHAAETMGHLCSLKLPGHPRADAEGFVPRGDLRQYVDGRSNGCTSWHPRVTPALLDVFRDDPTTLYMYPSRADVDAVAEAVRAHRPLDKAGLYWNADCLREIGQPRFWRKAEIEPILQKIHDAREEEEKLHPPKRVICPK